MRKYWSFFRIRFINGLQYRSAAFAGMATQFFWGGMLVLMYRAFFRTNPEAFPMTFEQTISYIWLQQAFFALINVWRYDNELFAMITDGTIAYELARPGDLYSMWLVKQLATRFSGVALRCLPVLVFAALLPGPYGLMAPHSILSLVMFLATLALGCLTLMTMQMLVYISVFYTLSPAGIRMVASMLIEFLCGQLVPLPFLPQGIRRVLELTPFAAIQNLPLRIYSGNIAGEELVFGVLLQLFWLAALILIGRVWLDRTLKHVVVQGG